MSGPFIVGLTGGIASGKTTVAAWLKDRGATVLDADALAREALTPGGACFEAVKSTFGPGILLGDGSIDRQALGTLVFSDERARNKLNSLVHPHVLARLQSLSRQADGLVVWDVPLLFEAGFDGFCRAIVAVTASEQVRVKRLKERNGATEEQALARIRSQMPEEEKAARASYVLVNEGSLKELKKKVETVYDALCQAMV